MAELVANLGFPIICFFVLARFMQNEMTENRKERMKSDELMGKELSRLSDVISNNTAITHQLIMMLSCDEDNQVSAETMYENPLEAQLSERIRKGDGIDE